MYGSLSQWAGQAHSFLPLHVPHSAAHDPFRTHHRVTPQRRLPTQRVLFEGSAHVIGARFCTDGSTDEFQAQTKCGKTGRGAAPAEREWRGEEAEASVALELGIFHVSFPNC